MSATCVRAAMLREDDPEHGDAAYELADAFCQQARLRIGRHFDALWHNTDAGDRRIAKSALAGEYEWLELGVLDITEGTGPWIAQWEVGPSSEDSVARRYLPHTES